MSGFPFAISLLLMAVAIFNAWPGTASAQTSRSPGNTNTAAAAYPNAPIRFVVPFAPGAGNDIVSRRVGQLLSESFHQPVIIDNQAGAGGIIGIAQVARSAPNGLTIGMGSTSTLAIGPYMMKSPPYDPVKDIAPVTLIASAPYLVVVHPGVPVSSLAELVAYIKTNAGKLNYSTAGIGTTPHLGVEMFKHLAGLDITHIPFKGAAPATAAAVAGEVQMHYGPLVSTLTLAKTKKLKALAMTGEQRSPAIPEVPTVAESGYPGYQSTNWYGIVVPARTPAAIIERLDREIARQIAAPEFRAQLNNDGAQVYEKTPKEFGDFIAMESGNYRKLIRELNLSIE